VTPSEFRAQFPEGEFNSTSSFPDVYVQKFLDAAVPMFNVARWASFYSEGLGCYVAHAIVVSKARAARGLVVDGGNLSSKSVGGVSASYDSTLLNKQASDTLMGTSYGRRYCELRDMVGMGGISGGQFNSTAGTP
jgi:hypothetical protein